MGWWPWETKVQVKTGKTHVLNASHPDKINTKKKKCTVFNGEKKKKRSQPPLFSPPLKTTLDMPSAGRAGEAEVAVVPGKRASPCCVHEARRQKPRHVAQHHSRARLRSRKTASKRSVSVKHLNQFFCTTHPLSKDLYHLSFQTQIHFAMPRVTLLFSSARNMLKTICTGRLFLSEP